MMGSHNLSLMFAPNLARPPKENVSGLSTAHEFVQELIENFDIIFADEKQNTNKKY